MSVYYLKNSTGAVIEVDDLGMVIADGQSLTIDINDIDGYLTDDMIAALDDNPANGLILSTTDIGDPSGDFTKAVAIERLTLKSHWKPSVGAFANLPLNGNEDGDVRLSRDSGILYKWSQADTEWAQITSTLSVEEYDGSPSGSGINKLVFVSPEDDVYIDGEVAYIGPPDPPQTLHGQALSVSGTSFYSGGLSQSNINYKSGDGAGSIVNYISKDAVFTASTPDTSNRCNYGDRGLVKVYLNGTAIVSVDMEANFNEANMDGSQSMSNYDVQGIGDPISNGIADFVGGAAGKGNLTILSVARHNSFKYYQKWSARINITDASVMRQGWNELSMTHEGLDSDQTSQTINFFYDTDTGSDPAVSNPTVTEDTPQLKQISGVSFYGGGSTWTIDVSGTDLFDNVYHNSEAPMILGGWPGLSNTYIRYDDASVGGVSTPPDIDEVMSISNWSLVQASNQISEDARITATPRDPYGTYSGAQSGSDGIMIDSYANQSDELTEYFRDEDYRLPTGTFDTIPADIDGLWDSSQSLDTYDGGNGLQVYQDKLIFPADDFTARLPVGPDYTSLNLEANKVYYRAFRDLAASHANGTLRMTGVSIAQLQAGAVKVSIKAPGLTGWLDLGTDYNYPTFAGADGDGCWVDRTSQSGSDFKFTIGQNYTENSGYMIIVKVEYVDNSAPEITHLEVIDW